MGILYTTAFAGGYLILTQLNVRQKLDEWLFGSIVGMADSDLWIAFAISAFAVLALTALQRPLLIYLFEPNIAASLGVPVRLLNYLTFAITILVLISSLQAVGCILSVGLLVVGFAFVLGVPLGLASGYLGGRTDNLLMRLVDAFLTFPPLLLAVALVGLLGPDIENVMLALGLVQAPVLARMVRGSTPIASHARHTASERRYTRSAPPSVST